MGETWHRRRDGLAADDVARDAQAIDPPRKRDPVRVRMQPTPGVRAEPRWWPARRRALQRLIVGSVVVACAAGSLVIGSGPSYATARKPSSTIATAPFTAPTGVTLTDTPPPWPLPSDARPYIQAAGLRVLSGEQLQVHYHAHLDVIVNGSKVTVPAGIGFVLDHGQATGITVLHTHDTSGVIHIESASNKAYTLGQVFTEWGLALSASQVGSYMVDATHSVAAYVDGHRFTGNPATLRLAPHLELALWYGPAGQTPHVPKSYHFSSGL